jgi:hypothetical protein
MRCFKLRVKSTSDAEGKTKGARRFANVWVNEKDLDKAEARARKLLKDEGWSVESIELSMAPSAEEIARLDPIQSAAHKYALSEGIYAYFTGLDA